MSSAPQEPSLRVRRRGPRGLAGSAPGFGVLAPPFGHLCDLAMHTVLCQPGRPPPCSHFPQAWAFLFPTGIFPLSVQLSKPAPGDAPPKKRGGGKALHPTFPAPDKAPSFLPAVSSPGQAATPKARGRRKLGAGATLLALSPPRPPGSPDSGQSSRGSKEKWGCHRLRRSSGAKGRGLGRVLDLAAGRRGPVPRCEAQ